MKRISLLGQITIIFAVAFLLTSLHLGILITKKLDSMYENIIFERLEAEGKSIRLAHRKDEYDSADNIAYIRYIKEDNTYQVSDNLMPYIDDESIGLLIGKAIIQTTYQDRYSNKIDDNQIYYIILNYQGVIGANEDIFIVIADSAMKHQIVKSMRLNIYFICLVSFLVGYLVILLWVMKFIRDAKQISDSLKKMGEDHYKNKISTKRKDEMGDLVGDIESMRLKLIDNEVLRQEVIQGISHDLKTPIALISSYAEAYEDGMCKADEVVAIAKKESQRLYAKVTKLLNLTRLGYIDTNTNTAESTQMKSLVEEVTKLYRYQDKIKISTKLSDVVFLGDKESWTIILQNILDNAMRYAENEIKIIVEDDKLMISNDGKKIEDELLSDIFRAYEKGDDGNSGLGLFIVKKTIEIFEYEASVCNLDDGVCFIIEKQKPII